jgi:hypothetical protein
MKETRAERIFRQHQSAIIGNKMMATRAVLGLALGVGAQKLTAVRVMLGVPEGSRKMFIKPLRDFLQQHPGFRRQDAASAEARKAFWKREKVNGVRISKSCT